ncbi:MAG: FKBP-type peptidyl-prolyl cis-trans isomerase [Deltaproteobacteria bacterium]|nr:FKBP-type peptidyl-prolyl cis-trans isomerase [Deltaproteobacteria bacterium]
MKLTLCTVFGIVLLAAAAQAEDPSAFKDQKEKLSYAIGADIATNMKKQLVEADPDAVARGMKDVFAGGKMLLTPEEIRSILTAYQQEKKKAQAEARKKLGEKNEQEGTLFLALNKSKEGVVTLPSGLQYKVLKQGDGAKPTLDDTVECQYRGTLLDGTEFDSSYKRGQSAQFPVKGVIKGWTEALQLMPVGSKWQLFIPADLAYGERGAGADIGPDATLIFEIELLGIKEKVAPAPKAAPGGAPHGQMGAPAKK